MSIIVLMDLTVLVLGYLYVVKNEQVTNCMFVCSYALTTVSDLKKCFDGALAGPQRIKLHVYIFKII